MMHRDSNGLTNIERAVALRHVAGSKHGDIARSLGLHKVSVSAILRRPQVRAYMEGLLRRIEDALINSLALLPLLRAGIPMDLLGLRK